jgi:hypothetical protein
MVFNAIYILVIVAVSFIDGRNPVTERSVILSILSSFDI